MSDKTLKIDVSDHEAQEVEERNDDDTDNRKNDILEYKDIDIKPKDSVTIQNTSYDKLHTMADEKIHKKISESKIDIKAYLRSEFPSGTALDMKGKQDIPDKLTKCKIYILSNRRKYKQSIRKRQNVYSRNTVVVQFMGSENLPENKVEMIYEPESRNYTVKTMFAMLLMMHFILLGGTLYVSRTPHDLFYWYEVFVMIYGVIGLLVAFILILCMMCTKKMRDGIRLSIAVFGTLLGVVGFGSFVTSIIVDKERYIIGFFSQTYATMCLTDIICILLGCTKFDYTSRWMYVFMIAVGGLCFTAIAFGLDWIVCFTVFGRNFIFERSLVRYEGMVIAAILTFIVLMVTVGELHIMLDGETIEMAEDDYIFGAHLLLVAIVDLPFRVCRKYVCKKGRESEDDEDE